MSRRVVWLPEGDWYNALTGEDYAGDRWYALYGLLKTFRCSPKPAGFCRSARRPGGGGIDNPADLHLHAYAGADGAFTLYEDDGDSREYQQGRHCETPITQTWTGQSLTLTVDPAVGETTLIPTERSLHLCMARARRPKRQCM
ncbi:MAG: DUF5110 domain-containing protein [Chloroflexi bacterium]|uniref:DUF5110 domain-containing protein n=1 Tax=Candidatus Flexifilum breve TaxID=3140694 RepID=UPI00313712C6|nr:DUF5110 domain-containing protein [Chloroflexota bacterium]